MTVKSEILKKPLITEKSVAEREKYGRYAFEVAPQANKIAIRQAVEKFFDVKVTDIKTMIVRGKIRRVGRYSGKRPNWKKAVVTLAPGQKIDLFEAK
jgi:large subunit ribosomal protein L23